MVSFKNTSGRTLNFSVPGGTHEEPKVIAVAHGETVNDVPLLDTDPNIVGHRVAGSIEIISKAAPAPVQAAPPVKRPVRED